jgi:hypothetical protein
MSHLTRSSTRSAARFGRPVRLLLILKRWRPASAQSNPAEFYRAGPANYYAEFWHENAINGKQYGFPYDDDASQSSDISVANPQYMIVAVGW